MGESYVLHSRKHGIIWKDPHEELEQQVYDEQCRLIDKEYGKGTQANLGWGVSGDKDHIDVCTKVYVEGHPKLRSVGEYKTGRITHEWL